MPHPGPHSSSSGPYNPMESPSRSAAHHQYQLQSMDMPGMPAGQDGTSMLNQEGGTFSPEGGPMTSTLSVVSAAGPAQFLWQKLRLFTFTDILEVKKKNISVSPLQMSLTVGLDWLKRDFDCCSVFLVFWMIVLILL